MTPDQRPAHEHRNPVDLPDWMRQPTPARRTPARLLDGLVERQPRLDAARRAWWRWRDRTRWGDSHPHVVAVVSFVVAAVLGTAAVFGAYYLFALAMGDYYY
ncbi:hypothetical protein [Micromonospora sp. NPDC093244]|uniref:hypothetical protein n=1 Tax=Micromonospora sp. NPDC093244 TaxID=3155071 RepID=UPI0034331C1E